MAAAGLLFPLDYADARRRFVDMATEAGFAMTAYVHPGERGPGGEALACDVACRGPEDARDILLVSSGTHGVEGFCGSGCQAELLRSGLLGDLPSHTAVLLVHALNPYGFAWLRRTNEDNVDLNRNFVDHSRHRPNPAYDEIHDWLVPADWDGPARAEADVQIARYIESRGIKVFQKALTSGQYDHPDGLFYGGRAPVWSNTTWRHVLRTFCRLAERVIAVDVHTGLGPRGVGEAICLSDEQAFARARDLFGDDVTWTGGGGSVSAQIGGSVVDCASEELGAGRLTMIGLEYGTYPIPQTLDALRAETWLVARGDPGGERGRQIKQALRDVFYIDEPDWKRDVVDRFLALVERVRPRLS